LHNLSDRALKERIVGAVVLVVFVVLVVPIFLDGPSDETEVISEVVSLPGQNNQERKQQTIVLDRDRDQPVPLTQSPAPRPQIEQPGPQQAVAETVVDTPVASSPQRPTEQPPVVDTGGPQSETGMWAVQLGSFSNKENAERLAADLRKQGYAAFLSQLQTDAGLLQRVRIGPQKDRESAEAVAAQLAKSGHKGQVVPHP